MTSQNTSLSNEQRRMASLLGLHPDLAERHVITINNLLHIEMMEGRHAMLVELGKIMGHRQ